MGFPFWRVYWGCGAIRGNQKKKDLGITFRDAFTLRKSRTEAQMALAAQAQLLQLQQQQDGADHCIMQWSMSDRHDIPLDGLNRYQIWCEILFFLVRNGSPKSNVGLNGNKVHETHIILLHYDIFCRSRCSASENRPRSVLRVKVFFGKGYLNLASLTTF